MARISGVNIPTAKKIHIALTYIYGIGPKIATELCDQASIDISKRVNENLLNSKIKNIKTYVGRYATSMEMAGMSITTLKLNDSLKKYLLAKSECPFWNN